MKHIPVADPAGEAVAAPEQSKPTFCEESVTSLRVMKAL